MTEGRLPNQTEYLWRHVNGDRQAPPDTIEDGRWPTDSEIVEFKKEQVQRDFRDVGEV